MAAAKITLTDNIHLSTLVSNLKFAKEEEEEDLDDSIQHSVKIRKETTSDLNNCETANGVGCLTCKCSFAERDLQREHYRTDWHRHNIKQRLLGQSVITEQEFSRIADSLSISGSDTDDSDDYVENFAEVSVSILKKEDDKTVAYSDDRRPRFYFQNEDNEIMSIYKKVLFQNQSDVADSDITSSVQRLIDTAQFSYWLIVLFSAGHFAAAVFQGTEVIAHKTFHRYIVRAKRGTVQSVNDVSNRGHTAKSAGASLRRHNEAALEESIRSLFKQWKDDYFSQCSHIFLRLPQYRKAFFYGGKEPLFNHKDSRHRSIPFITRRPTFNEVQRVHKELFSITHHGKSSLSELLPSPKLNGEKPLIKETDENQAHRANGNTLESTSIVLESATVSVVPSIEEEAVDTSFEITDNQKVEKKRRKQKQKKLKNSQGIEEEEQEVFSDNIPTPLSPDEEDLLAKLYTACKTSDSDSFLRILEADVASAKEAFFSHPLDGSGDTLLHVASRSGNVAIIDALLEHGADPAVRNKSKQVPYTACLNKESKNIYRRYRAKHPEKHDYDSALVPLPLSEEKEEQVKKKQAEKKKAQRAAKKVKDRMKKEEEEGRRKEEERLQEERTEKERFLALSDREKRLIALERRLVDQSHGQLSQAKRCFTCADSLFAKVPFEYFNYQFCSVNCLKIHKSKGNKS